MKLRKHVYDILETHSKTNRAARIVQSFIVGLITLNVLAVILESVDSIWQQYGTMCRGFEVFSVVVFTAEYVLRVWSCVECEKWRNPVRGRLQFALTPIALIDLLAVLPFYLPVFFHVDLRFLRALRLTRIFRLLKIGRYSESLRMLGKVISEKKEELLITVFVVTILLLMSSSLIYFAEHDAQPDKFGDIPSAMWWSVITLTTVGYGDVYPITPMGKSVAGVIALLGVALFAMPTAILASGLMEVLQTKKKETTCPHCGKQIE